MKQNIKFGLLEKDFELLAQYNADKHRGIKFEEDTEKEMKILQCVFDYYMRSIHKMDCI